MIDADLEFALREACHALILAPVEQAYDAGSDAFCRAHARPLAKEEALGSNIRDWTSLLRASDSDAITIEHVRMRGGGLLVALRYALFVMHKL